MGSPFKFQYVDEPLLPRKSNLVKGLLPSKVDAVGVHPKTKTLTMEDVPWVLENLKSDLSTAGSELKEGAKDLVVNHPASLALGLLGGATLPATLPGIATMGLLGGVGVGVDKLHPITGEKSDYETLSAKENLKDIGMGAGVNMITHGLFGSAPTKISDQAMREYAALNPIKGIAIPERGPIISGVPTRPATDYGGLAGYHVADYDLIPGANELASRLESQGLQRFIPAPSRMELPEGTMVGNPEWFRNIETPEGQILANRMASRAPGQANKIYSGVDRSYDPEAVTLIGKNGVEPEYKGFLDFFPDAEGNPILPKWASDFKLTGQSYGHPILRPEGYKDAIRAHIEAGTLPNPPAWAKEDPKQLLEWLEGPGYNDVRAQSVLKGDPRLEPVTQEFIPMFQNPKIIEMQGRPYKDLDVQMEDIEAARNANHDAIIYRNQRDFGGNDYHFLNKEQENLAANPHDVYTTWNPGTLKYENNYGLFDLNDYRPLASIPLAAGLGIYGYKGSNQ